MAVDTDSVNPPSVNPPRHAVRLRVQFCVVAFALGLFVVCTALYNLPDSTVKSRVTPAVNAVLEPWFQQDWHLFAPTPSTTHTHLLVAVRIALSDGTIRELPGVDVQYPLEDLQRENYLLPTKIPGVALAAQQRMADYAGELAAIAHADAAGQRRMHDDLDDRYRPTLDALARFMSRCAQDRYGSERIVAVRGTFTTTPMTPFSERDLADPAPQATKTIVTTSWDPFVPDVAR